MTGPHQGQPVLTAGGPAAGARAGRIMIHGRGATAQSILSLSRVLGRDDYAYLAPQAARSSWYPYSFLEPIPRNEPGISSGMEVIRGLLDRVGEAGVPPERVLLLGFSQ